MAKFWYGVMRLADAGEIGPLAPLPAPTAPVPALNNAARYAIRGALAAAAPRVPPNTAVIALLPLIKDLLIIHGPAIELPITQIARRIQYPSNIAPVPNAASPESFVGFTATLISNRVTRSQTAQASGQRQIATNELRNRAPIEISGGTTRQPRKIGEMAISIR